MFKINYESEALGSRWMVTEYYDPEDAYKIAKHVIDATPEILKIAVVEQDGSVYAEWQKGVS
jgi:hypothetical protein